MPSYEAGKNEDRQRMYERMRGYIDFVSAPENRRAGAYGSGVTDKISELGRALGLQGTAWQMMSQFMNTPQAAEMMKNGGWEAPDLFRSAIGNDASKVPESYVGRADAGNVSGGDLISGPGGFGRAGAGGFGGNPAGGGEVQEVDRPVSPYGYIINPDAYEYGGKKGLAEAEQSRYGGLAETARQQQAAYAQQYQDALAQSGSAREQQQQGLGYLRGLAEGTGPSAAQQQMNMGLAAARNQQASIAASARGGGANLAAAQAASAQAAGQMGIQGIQAAGLARAQEQLGAIGQYGQLAGQVREGDFDVARMQASQQQAQAIQQSQWEQYRQAIMAQQSQNQQNAEQQNLAREGAIRGWEVAQQQQQQQQQAQWIAAIGGAVSGLGSLASSFQSKPKVQP